MTSSGSFGRPKALAFRAVVVLLLCGLLLALPFVGHGWQVGAIVQWTGFLGRFHPMILHVPIGIFALLAWMEICRMCRGGGNKAGWPSSSGVCLGAASAVVAAVAGFLLARSGGYGNSELLSRHMWGGLAFAVLALITYLIRFRAEACGGSPFYYRMSLLLTVGVMCFAGHNGGSITHGPSYIMGSAPQPLRGWLGLPSAGTPRVREDVPVEKRVVYADLIAPVLERHCTQCHNASKTKGKLRMDGYAMLLKGGDEGPAINPGNAAQSRIIQRMALPMDDEDHMPPAGKPGLDARELSVLTWWLQSGADPVKTVGEAGMPPDVMAEASAILSSVGPSQSHAAASTSARY